MSIVLGIDVGGTGSKGNLVDTTNGEQVSERFKLATPKPSNPANVLAVIKEIIAHFDWQGKDVGRRERRYILGSHLDPCKLSVYQLSA